MRRHPFVPALGGAHAPTVEALEGALPVVDEAIPLHGFDPVELLDRRRDLVAAPMRIEDHLIGAVARHAEDDVSGKGRIGATEQLTRFAATLIDLPQLLVGKKPYGIDPVRVAPTRGPQLQYFSESAIARRSHRICFNERIPRPPTFSNGPNKLRRGYGLSNSLFGVSANKEKNSTHHEQCLQKFRNHDLEVFYHVDHQYFIVS